MRRPLRVRLAAVALLAPLALAGCGGGDDEPVLRPENGSDVDGESPMSDAGSEPLPVQSENPVPTPTG